MRGGCGRSRPFARGSCSSLANSISPSLEGKPPDSTDSRLFFVKHIWGRMLRLVVFGLIQGIFRKLVFWAWIGSFQPLRIYRVNRVAELLEINLVPGAVDPWLLPELVGDADQSSSVGVPGIAAVRDLTIWPFSQSDRRRDFAGGNLELLECFSLLSASVREPVFELIFRIRLRGIFLRIRKSEYKGCHGAVRQNQKNTQRMKPEGNPTAAPLHGFAYRALPY